MKVILAISLFALTFCFIDAYVSFVWSKDHAKSDPEKATHIVFVRVMSKKIDDETLNNGIPHMPEIIRSQVVDLRVSKVLKGNLTKGKTLNFSIGADGYAPRKKGHDPKDSVEDILPFSGLIQQNTQEGFDFRVGHSYLIFLEELSKENEYGRKYSLRSGPYSIGWVKYVGDNQDEPYIVFKENTREDEEKPIKLKKYLEELEQKIKDTSK